MLFIWETHVSAPQPRQDCSAFLAQRWGSGHCRPPTSLHRNGHIPEVSRQRISGPLLGNLSTIIERQACTLAQSQVSLVGGSGSKIGLQREGKRVSGPVWSLAQERWKEPQNGSVSQCGGIQSSVCRGSETGQSVKGSNPRSSPLKLVFSLPLMCVQTCPFRVVKKEKGK